MKTRKAYRYIVKKYLYIYIVNLMIILYHPSFCCATLLHKVEALPTLCNNVAQQKFGWKYAQHSLYYLDNVARRVARFCCAYFRNAAILSCQYSLYRISDYQPPTHFITDPNVCHHNVEQLPI